MQVETIQDWDDLLAIREQWERLSKLDEESGYFLSWDWLSTVLSVHPGQWKILAARPSTGGSDFFGFLPLKQRIRWSESSQAFKTEYGPAGKLAWAQYTGFVCDPAHEDAAIDAISRELLNSPWSRINFQHDGCQRQVERFISSFSKSDYRIKHRPQMINDGTVDNLKCPRITLPASYDAYLEKCLSSNTRQKMRRFWRRFQADETLSITDGNDQSFDADLNALLEFWERSWAPVRGRSSARRAVVKYREVLSHSQKIGAAEICTLWRSGVRLGALCSIVDRDKGHLYFIVAGRDEDVKEINVGLLLHTHNIMRAISAGVTTYDFCHGNEVYKLSYGATEFAVTNFEIMRRSECAVGQLDPSQLGEAMRQTIDMLEAKQMKAATHACRQLLPLIA